MWDRRKMVMKNIELNKKSGKYKKSHVAEDLKKL